MRVGVVHEMRDFALPSVGKIAEKWKWMKTRAAFATGFLFHGIPFAAFHFFEVGLDWMQIFYV
jgi:hypothetical protein